MMNFKFLILNFKLNSHSERSEESSKVGIKYLTWKIATSLTLLAMTFLFLVAIPYTLNPTLASHCDDLDPDDPDFETLCAARVNHQPQYCDGNKKFDNLNDGEHSPSTPNCSVGQLCVTTNPGVNDPNFNGTIVTYCQDPDDTQGIIGQACQYQQRVGTSQTQNCHGRYNYDPNDPTHRTISCQYYPGVDPQCSEAPAGRSVQDVFGKVLAPLPVSNIGFGAAGISKFLSNVVRLIYVLAGIIFLFMIIFSAFQWITSGGDKEAISKARGRLTNTVIGITILAVAGFLITLLGRILGFRFFS